MKNMDFTLDVQATGDSIENTLMKHWAGNNNDMELDNGEGKRL